MTKTDLEMNQFIRFFRLRNLFYRNEDLRRDMQARFERSRKLLRSGMTISDVALRTGFADQSHFTRQFKKFTGVTPAGITTSHMQGAGKNPDGMRNTRITASQRPSHVSFPSQALDSAPTS